MSEPKRYRHLVSGEAYGRRHEPGDPVDSSVPESKVKEWERAGIVKRERSTQSKRSKE